MSGATLAAAIAGTTGGAGAGVYDFSEGAGTISIPTGFTSLSIEVWGACGGGGWGTETYVGGDFLETQAAPGGGGGGGGYGRSVVVISGGDVGKTISYGVGTPGEGGTAGSPVGTSGGISSASAGTFTIDEIVCNGGFGGFGGLGVNGGKQGAGGTATGGNTTNTNGNGGANYTQNGAIGIAGVNSLTGGNGGDGGDPDAGGRDGQPGAKGRVRFVFS
jgi:hypothetical protein